MQDRLDEVVDRTREKLGGHLRAATTALLQHHGRHQVVEKVDAFLINTCRHLGAVCDVVLPVARHELDDGVGRVREYVHQTRRVERAVAEAKSRLYGESRATALPWAAVWMRLGDELARLAILERAIVGELSAILDDSTHESLAERIASAEETSPTRPHPLFPHIGRVAHLSRGLWARADRAWDTAEGRIVTHVADAGRDDDPNPDETGPDETGPDETSPDETTDRPLAS